MTLKDPILFRLRGIGGWPVQIKLSILFLAAFLVHFNGTVADVLAEMVVLLLLFLALYLHGLGQALAARLYGVPVRQITLSGGISTCDAEATQPSVQMTILAMGPLTNLTLWAVMTLIVSVLPQGGLAWVLNAFAMINLYLAALSLIPMRPLPGGALLQLSLSRALPQVAADRVVAVTGLICALAWIPAMLISYMLLGLLLFVLPAVPALWRMLHLNRAMRLREG